MSPISPLHYQPRQRYLVQFHPKRIPHVFTDVLIIGAGIAGIRAALEVDPKLRVVIVTKDVINLSNSAWAQGGIAGALDPSDDAQNHATDTKIAGAGLCNEGVVKNVVNDAPQLIRELAALGAKFDQKDGHIALTTEGGHSHARIAHALGDATGKEIMRALISSVRGADWTEIWEKTFTIDLLTSDGECRGALLWNAHHGRTFVWAKQVILATGGAGKVYRETTNPDIATADGHAIAYRAGAELRDMEMMQFHPTVLYIAGSSRHLITEAVRGEGGKLLDVTGRQFMAEYDERAELAPRDIVSRAITDQMEKTRHPCVYLDLSHLDPQLVRTRFPHINQVCQGFGLDLCTDRIPVRPGAHYMIGGLTIDDEGRSTLPNLWAAGEVTSSGLHGANRLASNSLLEGLYYGVRAGKGASEAALAIPDQFTFPYIESRFSSQAPEQDGLNIVDLQNSLGANMWRNVGIRRDGVGLRLASAQVDFWDKYVSTRELNTVAGWELQNMLLVSRLMIESALARTESRGVHFRSDYPEAIPEYARHITIQKPQDT